MSRFFPDVKIDFRELKGETIKDIDVIRAEFGRTYDNYILVTCESGKRVLFHGGNPWQPSPTLEEMRKTTFFTPDEIAEKVRWEEAKKRAKQEEEEERKRREYERLKKELGID
jgi:hypothetical protein